MSAARIAENREAAYEPTNLHSAPGNLWRSAGTGRPEEAFARVRKYNQTNPHYDPSLWFLALDGDAIAGVALCFPRTEDFPEGWVGTLAVRRPWRKLGLGLALLHHGFRQLQARGSSRVGLSVDAQSLTGATRLYERAGMHATREFVMFEKILRDGVDLSVQTMEA